MRIEIFDKPSTPCLATRFPYGTELTPEKLALVEQGEKILRDFGFNCCRLRMHGDIARIEIPVSQFAQFLTAKDDIIKALKTLNITYITLDMEGFRSGSMDIVK